MSDLNEFTFWQAACVQNPSNCSYPKKVIVRDADAFNEMARFDHVSATFKNCYRSNETFQGSDVQSGDVDNENVSDPNKWITLEDMFTEQLIDESGEEHELVSAVIIRLSNGYGIKIYSFIDYCMVDCVFGEDDRAVEAKYSEISSGIYNYEDIHFDEKTGLTAESSTVFFGKKGSYYAEAPSIIVRSEDKESQMFIGEWDFILFRLSITNCIQEAYDECENYSFDYKDWTGILNEAERILSFETFDELFDYLVSKKIKYSNTPFRLCAYYRNDTNISSYILSWWNEQDTNLNSHSPVFRTALYSVKTKYTP